MSQAEYVLTSSDEVAALSEQGRRLALAVAAGHIVDALLVELETLRDTGREGRFYDEDRQTMNNIIDTHLHTARRMLETVCRSTRFERDRYGYVNRIAGRKHLTMMPSPGSKQWDMHVRNLINRYKACQEGAALTALTAFYEATHPGIPEDYARMLLDI